MNFIELKNIKNEKDLVKMANKNLDNMKKFAIGMSDFIENKCEEDIEKLDDCLQLLIKYFDKFQNNKCIETFSAIVNIQEGVIHTVNVVIQNKSGNYKIYTKNAGYYMPLAHTISIIKGLKNNGFTKESILLARQCNEVQKTIMDYFFDNYTSILKLKYEEVFNYIDYISSELKKYAKNNSEEMKEKIKTTAINTTIKKEKIFNHKEMNGLLIKNGFEPIRQKGSHKMFSNGEFTIPVPQHPLGIGLSHKIQSQIKVSTS